MESIKRDSRQVAIQEALLYTGAVICGSLSGAALVIILFLLTIWRQSLLPGQPVLTLFLPLTVVIFIVSTFLAVLYTRYLTAKRAKSPRHGIGTVLLTMTLVGTYIFLGGLIPIDGRVHWRFVAECGLLIVLFQLAVIWLKIKPRPHIVMTSSSVSTILIFGGIASFVRPYYIAMLLVFLVADLVITSGKLIRKGYHHRNSFPEI